jgi:MFS family permease
MGRLLRIYFNAVLGGLGGLLGWMLAGEFFGSSFHEGQWNQEAALAAGAFIGAMIGYFVVSVDALMDRSLVRFCRYAAVGVVLGGLGGAAGYWVGDWVNYVLLKNVSGVSYLARGMGWALFGLSVGISEGIAARSMGKFSYGAVGGTLGGFIGGVIYAWLMQDVHYKDPNYAWGQALGLIIVGACIGSLIALVEEVLKPASLKVMRGWQEGREYAVVKPNSTLGRDEGEDILLLRDRDIEKHHAVLQRRGNRFFLVKKDAAAEQLLVNGTPVFQSQEVKDGDRLQLGSTVLKFALRTAMGRRGRK